VFKPRYEQEPRDLTAVSFLQSLIKADGGTGDFREDVPEKLGIWETLLKGEADATWVFRGWEGVEAQLKGVELNEFVLKDFG
jgi:hypothetical protein